MLQEWQMAQRRGLTLDEKILMSQARIMEWYNHFRGDVAVSFSGGKDSMVLLHLVRGLFPRVPAIFVDTGLEYPEIREFVKRQSNIEIIRPKYRFDEIIEKYGWPIISKRQARSISEAIKSDTDSAIFKTRMTGYSQNGKYFAKNKISKKYKNLVRLGKQGKIKISDKCCHFLKTGPINKYCKKNNFNMFMGITSFESQNRELDWKMNGCNAFERKIPVSRPLMAWSEQDILNYIKSRGLEIASIYGVIEERNGLLRCSGVQRTGCMFCMFGVHLEKEPNRFQKMQVTHPRQWDYIINKLNGKHILRLLNVNYRNNDFFREGQ